MKLDWSVTICVHRLLHKVSCVSCYYSGGRSCWTPCCCGGEGRNCQVLLKVVSYEQRTDLAEAAEAVNSLGPLKSQSFKDRRSLSCNAVNRPHVCLCRKPHALSPVVKFTVCTGEEAANLARRKLVMRMPNLRPGGRLKKKMLECNLQQRSPLKQGLSGGQGKSG